MKFGDKKRLRTCLSMLLVAVCLLTSFLFVNLDSNAQEQETETFYILDEDGNPVVVEEPQESMLGSLKTRVAAMLSPTNHETTVSETDENIAAHEESDWNIVRFQSSNKLVYFTEVDTGRQGYFNCMSAGDAAFIREESDGVVCKLAGVVMKVKKDNIKETVAFADCDEKQVSYYSVASNGYLVHSYTYYSGSTLALASTRVGYKPGYLSEGIKYYSYDGHYFYKDFSTMIADYRNGTYNNAENVKTPYYNYYQYLSFHTTSLFTAEQYNAHVEEKNKPTSVMLTAGKAFVAAQQKYTVNALLMYGLAINESAWGTSSIAVNKNNLFGLNAVDVSPGQSADTFSSVDACIDEFANHWIHRGFLNGTDSRYRGAHLGDKHSGLNVKYASDPYWGEKAAARGYYLDTEKTDYGRYTIGIGLSGFIKFYKEADVSSTVLYTSEAGEGEGKKAYLYDFPVVILGSVTGTDGTLYYKVLSDMSLQSDRNKRDVTAIYNTNRDYVYVQASNIQIVFRGSGASAIPTPDHTGQGKTQEEVLAALHVANSEDCLSGFALGSDVSSVIAQVNALDSNIQVSVKDVNGTQVTSGTIVTGMTMSITTNGSTVTYAFVIRGDISGDGKLSALDYVKLRNYLDGISTLNGAFLKSADTNNDGKISAVDYVKLRNHLDDKSTIIQ